MKMFVIDRLAISSLPSGYMIDRLGSSRSAIILSLTALLGCILSTIGAMSHSPTSVPMYLTMVAGRSIMAVGGGSLRCFPQVGGCIDGTFIPIQGPCENEEDFVNRKGFHSLNIQPGSVHDARMFRDSHLRTNFENGTFNGFLLGDSAYLCSNYLMTPYNTPDTRSKQKFNNALCRTRVTIEQTFGILKRRFSCLHTGLRVQPQKAATIVFRA
ncbi:putative nuclease HARBI1 [Mizuhopecten yessoensis]|uniref:putative nuclease HARBI1 n=1 Tax=Mizuhopecten yessoensis TaxID=6573 RepID=UPI000B45D266|nr:putative nuclease HARBI1 [Mizuhopecten yessoensis]